MELCHKHRPKRFSDVIGQPELTKMLISMVNRKRVPRVILFHGPPGTSKTTCARILAKKVGCNGTDLVEINVADFRGIDTARDIRASVDYLLKRVVGLESGFLMRLVKLAKTAQNAFLKILEEVPDHAYFFLATTDPQKLIPTIRSRCTQLATKALDSDAMETLLASICKKEKVKISTDVRDRIVEVADGSARNALKLLDAILNLDDEQEQLEVIYDSTPNHQAIELVKLLMKPNTQWREAAKLIKTIKDEPESIRRLVLAYVGATALNKPFPDREIHIIDCFSSTTSIQVKQD